MQSERLSSDSLNIPTRNYLLRQYKHAMLLGRIWFGVELFFIWASLFFISWQYFRENLLEGIVVLGIGAGPTFLGFAYLFTKKKKRVEDLREDVQFGKLRKGDILDVISQVCNRMDIERESVSFFVTGDKSVNASALTLGLGWISPRLRSVFFHRGTLHALDKEEFATVVGHELAHIFRYPLYHQRFVFLNLLASALLGLAVWSWTSGGIWYGLMAIGIYNFVYHLLLGNFSIVIEYLCDDCGAEVGGLEPALRAEYLVSQHAELVSRAYRFALEKKLQGSSVSAKELTQLIDDSLTFDAPSAELVELEIRARMESKEVKSRESFITFIKGLVFGDSIDSGRHLENELEKLKWAAKAKRLELPAAQDGRLTRQWFRELVERVKAEPSRVLFQVPEELPGAESSHPSPRKRIVYLWETFSGITH